MGPQRAHVPFEVVGNAAVTGYGVTFAKSLITANEHAVVSIPNVPSQRRPIIFCHGYTPNLANGAAAVGSTMSAGYRGKLFQDLCRLGSVVVSGEWGGNLFGNDASADMIEAARLFAVSKGALADKAVLVGESMGFVSAFGYARQYPQRVAAVFGYAPLSSMQQARDAGGIDPNVINAAFGIAAGQPVPARFDPTQSPATLAEVPGRLYYGSADTIVPASTVVNLAQLLGWQALEFDSANDHVTEAQMANFPRSALQSDVRPHLES